MRSLRSPAALAIAGSLVLALVLASRSASAHPGITGYSGKPYNGISETCTTNCHASGANPPALTITVPQTVQAGSTSQVTIVVAGNRTRTSMNAAFSDGVKTIKGSNTDTPLAAQEPTEIAAVVPPPNGSTATYKLSFIAPNANGPITMYVAGMAASGGGTGGDAVTVTTRMITVTGAEAGAPIDAGSSSGTDAGSDASASGGTSGGTGSGGGTSGDAGSSGASSSSGRVAPGSDTSDSGCAIASRNASSAPLMALLTALSLATLRRRSRA